MKNKVIPKISGLLRCTIPSGKQAVPSAPKPVVQNWLPVQNVFSGLITRSDGCLVGAIRVEPAAFGLLSPVEKKRRIGGLHEAIQSLTGAVQICTIPRPIDLDAYIVYLESQLFDAEGSRKTVLRGYIQYVRRLMVSAEAMERRFYVLMTEEEKKKKGREELLKRMGEFMSALGRAELQSHICSDQEVLDLMFCFFHPAQTAFEQPVLSSVSPVYFTAKDVMDRGLN